MNRRLLGLALPAALALALGCSCHRPWRCGYFGRPCPAPAPGPCDACGPPAPAPITPVAVPPGGAPPPAPPAGLGRPGADLTPPPGNGATLGAPEAGDPGAGRESSGFYPPESKEPPPASVPSKPVPTIEEEPDPPVDLPGFALAKPRVATGQRPFPDGVNWLKANGYKSALHVRAPGADDAAAKRQFETKGLRYLTLEVSPATLTEEVARRFSELVTDPANLPLFAYDKDGSRLGGLWYLHFRLHEKQSDEKAREQAARLGFKADDDGEHRTMWLAVQELLRKRKP